MVKTDFIIVGQGLAGSILALKLIKQGKKVIVIDRPSLSRCSQVAAGIYNPVVFKRFTQSWMAEKALPVMHDFFEKAEKSLKAELLHPIRIAKVLANENEESQWKKKSQNELADFVKEKIKEPGKRLFFLKNNYAYVKQAGYVDVPFFLKKTRDYLKENNLYLGETFHHKAVSFEREKILYKDIICSKIIFCEGALYHKNPWFKTLKFKPAKGEILTIYSEELKLKSILNKDIFIMPLPLKHYYKVGATYNWDDLTDTPTEKAKEELVAKLNKIIPFTYKIIKHEAGVRPSTIDRRPVMGFHPEHKNIGVFNGFGTKAVLLAPYFAKHFCNSMEAKTELWKEIDVKRFLN